MAAATPQLGRPCPISKSEENRKLFLASKFAIELCLISIIYAALSRTTRIIRSLDKFMIGSIDGSRPPNSSTKAAAQLSPLRQQPRLASIARSKSTLNLRNATKTEFWFKEQRSRKYPCTILLGRAKRVSVCRGGRRLPKIGVSAPFCAFAESLNTRNLQPWQLVG